MPATPDDLIRYLTDLNIEIQDFAHAPVVTVAQARDLRGQIPGGHTKNLFLRDRARALFLIVAEEDKSIDLKTIHETIGARGRVSFGSAELLEEVWGVKPGAVTPFGALNDRDGRVKVVLDGGLMAHDVLNFHPLVNTRTIGLARDGLLRFLRATAHAPLIAALPG